MSYKATDHVFDKVTFPTAVNGTTGRPFSVPKGAKSVIIHMPTLIAGTYGIDSLQPQDNDQAAETWRTAQVAVLSAATASACTFANTVLAGNTATVIPATALGGGILRFNFSAAQTGAADALTAILGWEFEN